MRTRMDIVRQSGFTTPERIDRVLAIQHALRVNRKVADQILVERKRNAAGITAAGIAAVRRQDRFGR